MRRPLILAYVRRGKAGPVGGGGMGLSEPAGAGRRSPAPATAPRRRLPLRRTGRRHRSRDQRPARGPAPRAAPPSASGTPTWSRCTCGPGTGSPPACSTPPTHWSRRSIRTRFDVSRPGQPERWERMFTVVPLGSRSMKRRTPHASSRRGGHLQAASTARGVDRVDVVDLDRDAGCGGVVVTDDRATWSDGSVGEANGHDPLQVHDHLAADILRGAIARVGGPVGLDVRHALDLGRHRALLFRSAEPRSRPARALGRQRDPERPRVAAVGHPASWHASVGSNNTGR